MKAKKTFVDSVIEDALLVGEKISYEVIPGDDNLGYHHSIPALLSTIKSSSYAVLYYTKDKLGGLVQLNRQIIENQKHATGEIISIDPDTQTLQLLVDLDSTSDIAVIYHHLHTPWGLHARPSARITTSLLENQVGNDCKVPITNPMVYVERVDTQNINRGILYSFNSTPKEPVRANETQYSATIMGIMMTSIPQNGIIKFVLLGTAGSMTEMILKELLQISKDEENYLYGRSANNYSYTTPELLKKFPPTEIGADKQGIATFTNFTTIPFAENYKSIGFSK